jgi:ABC-2 type transport system ATP-binding protein
MDYVIETQKLTKLYKKTTVVDDLELHIPKNSIYGFLGPNGAGKTTTIRMLLGLIRPARGNISIFGKDFSKNRIQILKDVGTLVETPSIYGHLTGRENLKTICNILNIPVSKIDETLTIVNLQDAADKKTGDYSLGMKQRLGLAMALINDPKLLILDEPTNGLDPQGIREIRTLLQTMPEKGITVFISSHLLSEIELVATHVGIINKGKLLFEGRIQDLEERSDLKILIQTDQPDKAIAILKQKNISASTQKINTIEFMIDDKSVLPSINKALVEANIDLYTTSIQSQTLEDIFLKLTNN